MRPTRDRRFGMAGVRIPPPVAAQGHAEVPSYLDPKFVIVTVTDGGGVALFTTLAPHGLTGFELITVTGTTVPGYNDTSAPTVTGATSFTFDFVPYTTDASGGRWRIV